MTSPAETLGGTPELEPTSFALPVGVARVDVEETPDLVRYTPDWTFNAFCTNVRDVAVAAGKPVIATYEGQQFVAYPEDDRNTIIVRYGIDRQPADPMLTYQPPTRY